MEIFKSQKGMHKLAYKGFSYLKSTTNVTSQNWKCDQKSCRGSLSTPINYSEGQIATELRPHNHPADPSGVELKVAQSRAIEHAAESAEPPRRVVSETLAGLGNEARARGQKRKAFAQRIQRKRRRIAVGGLPPEPTSITDFEVPECFRNVVVGGEHKTFLLHDDLEEQDEEDPDADRIIVFASREMMRQLESATVWMADGTFKTAPQLYFQMYTLHAVRNDYVFPCVYALLPNKRQATYVRLLQILQHYYPRLSPTTCIVDLEQAAIQAFRTEFPNIRMQTCFFHQGQAVYRKVQDLGLANEYNNNEESRTLLKMLCALAFLPENSVADGFDTLSAELEEANVPEAVAEVFDYFEDTYIGRRQRRGRRRAMFPISMWNVRTRTEEGIPRTNNKLEGWHRAFQTQFDSPHPTMWRFMRGLHREEGLQQSLLQQMISGHPGPVQEKKYDELNRRLTTLIRRNSAGETTTVEFLRGVSYNLLTYKSSKSSLANYEVFYSCCFGTFRFVPLVLINFLL